MNQKIKNCFLKLLNTKDLRFFGYLIYNIDIECVDFNDKLINQQIFSYLSYKSESEKFILEIDNTFINESEIDEILYIIIQNILYMLNYKNVSTPESEYINQSEINNQLNEAIKNNELTNIKQPKKINNDNVKNINKYLNNPIKSKRIELYKNSSENTENNKNKSVTIYYQINNKDNLPPIIKNEINSNLEQITKIQLNSNILLQQEHIRRGFKTSNFLEFLEKITQIKLNWEQILTKAILLNNRPSQINRSWTNPYKRFRAHNIIIPGPGTEKYLELLTIVTDVSGSISKENLKKFIGICHKSFDNFKKVWLIKHDSEIKFNQIIDIQDIDREKLINLNYTNGGTDHLPVFKLIEDKYLKREYKIGLILMLTDFESNIEEIFNKFTWTKKIPTIYLLTKKRVQIENQIIKNNVIYIDE